MLSWENEISGEVGSVNLSPMRTDPKLRSELVETREFRAESMQSQKTDDEVLGLPELTNDMSVSESPTKSMHDLPLNPTVFPSCDLFQPCKPCHCDVLCYVKVDKALKKYNVQMAL